MNFMLAGIAANNPVNMMWDLDITSYDEAQDMHDRMLEAVNNNHVGFDRFCGDKIRITKDSRGNVYIVESDDDVSLAKDERGTFEIIFYDTCIVKYYADGSFSVDNGGFNTPTTSTRINQFTPRWFSVSHVDKKLVALAANVQRPSDFRAHSCGWYICNHDRPFAIDGEGA